MHRSSNSHLKVSSSNSSSYLSNSSSSEYKTSYEDSISSETSYHRPLAIATRSSSLNSRAYEVGNIISPPSISPSFSNSLLKSTPLSTINSEPIKGYNGSSGESIKHNLNSKASNLINSPFFKNLKQSKEIVRPPTIITTTIKETKEPYQSSTNGKIMLIESPNRISPVNSESNLSPTKFRPLPTVPYKSPPSPLGMKAVLARTSTESLNSNSSLSQTKPLPKVPNKQTIKKLGPGQTLRSRANSDITNNSRNGQNKNLYFESLLSGITKSQEGKEKKIINVQFVSEVLERFICNIPRALHTKNSLEYPSSFTGKDIVDTLSQILQTEDRKLCLSCGQCFEFHKLFHDVTFESSLKDSISEIYTFRDYLSSEPFDSSLIKDFETIYSTISGVFTNLTPCYSPTCSKSKLCYSPMCPRKVKNGLINFRFGTPVNPLGPSTLPEPMRVWARTVPKSVLDTTSVKEKKRQEAIYEFIYTEKDFVEDIEILQEFFIKPLLYENIISTEKRDEFIEQVFFNISEIHSINHHLMKDLIKRQEEQYVVDQIGDIFLDHVKNFEPFVAYGAHQLFAKQALELEITQNQNLARFLEEKEQLPQLRKLPIQSFMGRPTTRLAKYSLLLEAIIKHTESDNPDIENMQKVIKIIKGFLNRINIETGKADNKLKLTRLSKLLLGNGNELKMLNLMHDNRILIRDGTLKKKTGVDQVDISLFLFDHLLLLTKRKSSKEHNDYIYKIHKKPIPLELIKVIIPEESSLVDATSKRSSNGFVSRRANSFLYMGTNNLQDSIVKSGYPLNITHLGRDGQTITLYANTLAERKQWKDKIEKQRGIVTSLTNVYEVFTISTVHFKFNNPILSTALFNDNERILIGTEEGVYLGSCSGMSNFQKIIDLEKVYQIEILEEYNMLILLSDKSLYTFAMDTLNNDSTSVKIGRKISSHVTFFKVGVCLGRVLVCVVKATPLSSVVKALEPVLLTTNKKAAFGKFLMRAGKDGMRLFKKFYIPSGYTSLHFLKTKICVGCAKGFEIVDLETLNTQGLLDETDASLNFVLKREVVKPIAIYKVSTKDFLLCYDEFAFYVDKDGRRTRLEFIILWEGEPTSFAFEYPYILGFNPDFIEIWDVDKCKFCQVIPTCNSRSLSTLPGAIHCVNNPIGEFQQLFALRLKNKSNVEA
ncbi:CNH-domain-containing protein [Neoconidiobolus thromboides FSU 785]|nr:CNH-domain-containing protein [Neoconidiobolus thromboides FSU 785]